MKGLVVGKLCAVVHLARGKGTGKKFALNVVRELRGGNCYLHLRQEVLLTFAAGIITCISGQQ